MSNTIQLKRFDGLLRGDPSTIFPSGELVWDYTRKSLRIGDGSNIWSSLVEFPTQSVTSFLALTDTPATYGLPGQVPVVNEAGTGLEFATVASSYTLPIATDSVLGGVKIGSGITITDGVISTDLNDVGYSSVATTATLPASPDTGEIYEFIGTGANWTLTANTGQYIRMLSTVSASAGTLASTSGYDCVCLIYIGSNVWLVKSHMGILDVI